ncbi:MAG: TIGR04141 family sporadically distributed protein [Clostridia bacterium]|nr:TIGR04141 family sporadically distributed protein [Clostridia bacterium]
MAKINLSIFLIKENITNLEDIIEDGVAELQVFDENSVAYYNPSSVKEPDWLFSFFSFHNDLLKTANSRVLFLKRVQIDERTSRIFAVTFGYGKTLLKDDVCEEQFGLKIVLNTIARNKIRKISKTDIGKNYKQSQEQMPKESDISEFGFDIDRDLIKYVTGKSDDEEFGKSIISGGDIFNLVIDKNITNIENFLKYCYNKYILTTYKENFEWLDNIKLVKDKEIIEKLNDLVVKELNERNFSNVWLAIPEFLNWEKVDSIYIAGQKDRNAKYNDIENDVFVDSFENGTIIDFDKLKSKIITVKSTEDNEQDIAKWSAAKCIVGSLELDNGNVYAINGGSWYRINRDFANDINNAYKNLKLADIDFIDCPKEYDEDKYNKDLANTLQGAHLIHKYKIPYGGGTGNVIEPCDVAIDKTLIHIKNNGGSAYLSHLFNQATNSCSLLMDADFRDKFRNKLRINGIDDVIGDNFNASDYTIVLGIINKNHENRPHIPFFSKVSIKYAATQIENLGYKFRLKTIKKL